MPATRTGGWPGAVLFLWLITAIVLIVVMRGAIPGGWLKDTDDYMRLVEVRDWIAGQGWYDVGQHRLNPPEGAAMHWTRLVDLPLAAGFILLRPLLGASGAEIATMVAVPLLLLLAAMLTVGWTLSRLVRTPGAAELGPVLLVLNIFTAAQFMPLRIDHHGWQLLMAAIAAAGLIAERGARGGAIAGAALGFWLTVSLEGLPFAAVCLAATGLWWAFDPRQAGRLAALAGALALSAAAFFLITIAPSAWAERQCDATSAGQLAALAVAALGVAALIRLPALSTPLRRLLALGPVAVAAGGALMLLAPQCLANPFGRLDPLVYNVWYLHVREGLPIWRLSPDFAVQILFMPMIALAGSLWKMSRTEDEALKWRWIVMTLLLAGSMAIGLLVMRANGVAAIMAVPGALVLVSAIIGKVRAARFVAVRTIGTAAALLLPTPLGPALAVSLVHERPEATGARVGEDDGAAFEAIDRLPAAIIFAPLDATPSLIARTRHSAIAGPYHRNDRAIADVIRAYAGSTDEAHRIVRRHRAAYVLSTRSAELNSYRRLAPHGLAARLAAGRPPGWLRPVSLPPGNIRLWRVVG